MTIPPEAGKHEPSEFLLRDGVKLRDDMEPTVVFDGVGSSAEAHFGYEDADGEWHDAEWPFASNWVTSDDCRSLGIRVKIA